MRPAEVAVDLRIRTFILVALAERVTERMRISSEACSTVASQITVRRYSGAAVGFWGAWR